ncbi:hypothetical protein I316_00531 [Kwoniella heveanensis BCC8398]|uniref:Uncharacterized protein n=1 Tax=Kwoniella heveanensis BCC8398 TaxID=1296120 RepID=A0A1B9H2B4_9TREE|nr:hypothetical protein I316_00531 [Kwoniella heveanensis BCC8398]
MVVSAYIDRALVNHLVCIAGVHVGSQYALKTYMAIYSLATYARNSPSFPVAPSESSDEKSTSAEQGQGHTRPWWRKVLSKDGAIFLVILSSILATQLFLVFVLPRITSQLVMDVFWTGTTSYLVENKINRTIETLYPTPIVRKLRHSKENNWYHSEIIPRTDVRKRLLANKRLQKVISVLLTAIVMGQAYVGVEWVPVAPLVAAGFVIDMAGHMFYPKVSVRRAVQAVLGVLIIASVAGFSAGPIIGFFKKDKSADVEKPKEDKPPAMALWITDVAMMFNVGMGFMLPAALMAVTLRFEYMRSSLPTKALPVDTEHKVVVPTRLPKFERPIFNTGLVSFVIGTLIYNLVVPNLIELEGANRNAMMLFCAGPSAIAGLVTGAWFTGQFSDWWLYHDEWYPDPPKSGQDESGPLIDEEQTVAFADHDEKVVNDLVQLEDHEKVKA